MALIRINGRKQFVNVDSIEITSPSKGRFVVRYDDHMEFQVSGGTASGGAANEWFVRHELFYGDQWLRCSSMIEAIRKGCQY